MKTAGIPVIFKTMFQTRFAFVAVLGSVLVSALPAAAGQLYGSIVEAGKPVASAPISISCAGAETTGTTGADGQYRINVSQEGRCSFSLPSHAGKPTAVVFSQAAPSAYNFEVAKKPDGSFELRVR